jgi:NAD(P)H-flavin reductase
MHTGTGQVLELILEDENRYVRLSCSASLIPMPGQYLLASDGSGTPLPVPLFYTDSAPQGFIAAAPSTAFWRPGLTLHLRGPLGRGFSLPPTARKIGLVAFDDSPARLRGLIRQALRQDAAVVLVGSSSSDNLPDDVEVQPLTELNDILEWADYAAFDIARENLHQLKEQLGKRNQLVSVRDAQVLVRTPIPCGGIAECGVCAVTLTSEWRLACKDGPVFDWRDLA